MQRVVSILTVVLLGLHVFAQAVNDKILGRWINEDQTRVIEFVRNGNNYDAIIRKADDKSLIGKKQITGLQSSGVTSFINGTIHIIKKGKTAKCTATLSADGKLYIEASYGMMSRSQTWTRVE